MYYRKLCESFGCHPKNTWGKTEGQADTVISLFQVCVCVSQRVLRPAGNLISTATQLAFISQHASLCSSSRQVLPFIFKTPAMFSSIRVPHARKHTHTHAHTNNQKPCWIILAPLAFEDIFRGAVCVCLWIKSMDLFLPLHLILNIIFSLTVLKFLIQG